MIIVIIIIIIIIIIMSEWVSEWVSEWERVGVYVVWESDIPSHEGDACVALVRQEF